MSFTSSQRARSAVIDQLDKAVLRRMETLLDRARRGTGRRVSDVHRLLEQPTTVRVDNRFVRSIAELSAPLWDRETGELPDVPEFRQMIIDQFCRLYFNSKKTTWKNTHYRGVKVLKCPLDLWVYQELVHELRPDLIIETGTAHGGSAYFLSDLCDTVGNGEVVTIDIGSRPDVDHPRLTKLSGSSIDPEIVATVEPRARAASVVMVLLDSDHSAAHVLDELKTWSDFVTPGSYLIVEDGIVNGRPVLPSFGPGPTEAVEAFLRDDDRFEVDEGREKFLVTFNPGGFLRRVD